MADPTMPGTLDESTGPLVSASTALDPGALRALLAEANAKGAGTAPTLLDEVERLRAALQPFAAAATPRVLDPHPCTARCWRVGAPAATPGGVCVECGTRARRDDESAGFNFSAGQLRTAADALAGVTTPQAREEGRVKARPPLKPLDLYMVQSATERARAYLAESERWVESARTDAQRERRLAERECRWCFYRTTFAGQAFTDWTCWACGAEGNHANTSVPRLCNGCADRLGLCVHCCADRELKRRKTLERK